MLPQYIRFGRMRERARALLSSAFKRPLKYTRTRLTRLSADSMLNTDIYTYQCIDNGHTFAFAFAFTFASVLNCTVRYGTVHVYTFLCFRLHPLCHSLKIISLSNLSFEPYIYSTVLFLLVISFFEFNTCSLII